MDLTDSQLKFWRALNAPFLPDAYCERAGKEGRSYVYLKPRTLQNRLDDVCGPSGWEEEYVASESGVICTLRLAVPGDTSGGHKHVSRCGAGGFQDPKTLDDDDDAVFKAAMTNAFKVACSHFGLGRDLYNEGMPAYIADLFDGVASAAPQAQRPPLGGQGGKYNNFVRIPFGKTKSKAVYAWAMNMGQHFQVDVLGRMGAYAKKTGNPIRTDEWDGQFLDDCLRKTIEWLKSLDNYNGEFEQADNGPAQQKARDNEYAAALEDAPANIPNMPIHKPPNETQENKLAGKALAAKLAADAIEAKARTMAEHAAAANQAKAEQADSPEMVTLKRAVAAAVNALLLKKLGRGPTQPEFVAELGDVAAGVPNSIGCRGEVLASLKYCVDRTWLVNIKVALQERIAHLAQMDAASSPLDDLPC